MEAEQALKQYAAGRRDFSWIDLSKANLKQANLSGATLYQANLSQANLAGADLSQANLNHANLVAANLRGSNLRGTKLSKADLSGAQLQGTDLTGANLKGANLKNADLSGANLFQTKLPQAYLAEAILLETNIEAAELTEAVLTGATMPDGTNYDLWQMSRSSQKKSSPANQATKLGGKPSNRAKNPPRVKVYTPNQTPTKTPPSASNHDRQRPRVTERRQLSNEEFWECLPLPSLFLLFLGYMFFGLLLTAKTSFWLFWALAWVGSISWVFNQSLTWLTPVSGAVAVLLAVIISLPSQGLMMLMVGLGGLTLVSITALKVLGLGVLSTVKDALWLVGLVIVAFVLAAWFFWGSPITWPLILGLFLAMASAGLGSIAGLQMDADGFSERQIFWIFGSMTALGLLVAWLIGRLFF